MKDNKDSILLHVLKAGLYVIPLLVLFVTPTLIFPFVTGRNFLFRIVVEILFFLWLVLITQDRQFIPQKNILNLTILVYVFITLISNLLGGNFYHSFFSTFERMDGFINTLHWLMYYFMLVSLFDQKRDWKRFFVINLLVGFIVAVIGVTEKFGITWYDTRIWQRYIIISSTFGNQGVLAFYQTFIFWINLFVLYQYRKIAWVKYACSAFIFIQFYVFYLTAVRSTFVTLLFVIFLALLVFILFYRKLGFEKHVPKIYRTILSAVFLVFVILLLTIYLNRDTQYVRDNYYLNRLTTYNLDVKSVKIRLLLWDAGWQGVLEKPVLGWGQENYYLILQKYYNPEMNYQRFWYDRAHNVFLQKLIDSGFAGLLIFLSVFGIIGFLVIKKMKDHSIAAPEGLFIIISLIAYLVFNIFYFDVFASHMYLYSMWAFSGFMLFTDKPGIKKKFKYNYGLAIAYLLIILFSFNYTIRIPVLQAKYISDGYEYSNFNGKINAFKKALKYDGFGTTEAREHLGSTAITVVTSKDYSFQQKKMLLEFAINELRKEIKNPKSNVRPFLLLGSCLNIAGEYGKNYLQEAEYVLKKALQKNPKMRILYNELAQTYRRQGDMEKMSQIINESLKYLPHIGRIKERNKNE